ncbi:dynamin family protein [Nakamurella sp. A5-74]|uniref:Dynamin family protein n=1 Tax=Nakamurella sp. A5-74 TaxID=3158264 RepID=A0AAU8DRT9_9ACTN
MQGPLSQSVAALCRALLPQVSPRTAGGIGEILRRLDTPLQLAVAGRIKSGKSTLVNALIGRRVAPTDIGECTRLVTRFQYGTVDRIEVVHRDGRRTTVPFAPDGGIPPDLTSAAGISIDEVSHLEAYLTSALLADVTVIDTPGLGSMDTASVSRTEALLGTANQQGAAGDAEAGTGAESDSLDRVSEFAVAGAEAVVYVFTQSVRSDDTQVLAAFTAATASRDAGPVNALGVLNKADTIPADSVEGSGGDAWTAARLVAQSQAALLRPRVADVLPMNGLLAETSETGAFTGADAEALRTLAGVDPALFDAMMMAADLFTTLELGVPGEVATAVRMRLLQLLDLYGINIAVQQIRAEPAISAGELRRRLSARSGLEELRRRLGEVFRLRADGIKASAALASIGLLASVTDDVHERQRITDGIEMLLQRPAAHQLRLMEALTLVSGGSVRFDTDLTGEILRLGSSTHPEEMLGLPQASSAQLQTAALERAGWWRSFASFGATPAQARIAHVVHRAYFLLWQQLSGHRPTTPQGLAGGRSPGPAGGRP